MISTYKKKRLRQDLFLSEFVFFGGLNGAVGINKHL